MLNGIQFSRHSHRFGLVGIFTLLNVQKCPSSQPDIASATPSHSQARATRNEEADARHCLIELFLRS